MLGSEKRSNQSKTGSITITKNQPETKSEEGSIKQIKELQMNLGQTSNQDNRFKELETMNNVTWTKKQDSSNQSQ